MRAEAEKAPTLAQWLESEERKRAWYLGEASEWRSWEKRYREIVQVTSGQESKCAASDADHHAEMAEMAERAAAACWRGMESAPANLEWVWVIDDDPIGIEQLDPGVVMLAQRQGDNWYEYQHATRMDRPPLCWRSREMLPALPALARD